MIDFEKNFKEMFADLLSNPDVIKEAEEEAEAELKAYRAKKQAEFEHSEIYKKAHKAAVQQLKEQKLSEGMASIDKEFEAKTAQMTNFLSNPTKLSSSSKGEKEKEEKHPLTKEERSEIMKEVWAKRTPEEKAAITAKRKTTIAKKKETRLEKIKRTRKELEEETSTFVRNQIIEALFQISFNNENTYSSDNIYYAIEQGKSAGTTDQALATVLEIALENGIDLNEIKDRARMLVGEDVPDSSFNEIFDMYASINGDERLYKEVKARSNVVDFNNPADKKTDYSALEEFKKFEPEGFGF